MKNILSLRTIEEKKKMNEQTHTHKDTIRNERKMQKLKAKLHTDDELNWMGYS